MSLPSDSVASSSTNSPETVPFRPRALSRSSGTIKSFDSSQGQGWIRPSDGSKEVHFHLSNLQTNIKTLFPGQKIFFAVKESDAEGVEGANGETEHPIAIDVEAEDGHLEPRFLRLGH